MNFKPIPAGHDKACMVRDCPGRAGYYDTISTLNFAFDVCELHMWQSRAFDAEQKVKALEETTRNIGRRMDTYLIHANDRAHDCTCAVCAGRRNSDLRCRLEAQDMLRKYPAYETCSPADAEKIKELIDE